MSVTIKCEAVIDEKSCGVTISQNGTMTEDQLIVGLAHLVALISNTAFERLVKLGESPMLFVTLVNKVGQIVMANQSKTQASRSDGSMGQS